MFKEAVYPKTKEVLNLVWPVAESFGFYLAGGTGLALQLGHRRSIDLDFFAPKFPERDLLLSKLREFSPQVTQEAPGTLDLLIKDVKVSFLEYEYHLLEELVRLEDLGGTSVASVLDIACMKLTAVSSRGTKKDFFDFYFILQQISWADLWSAFAKKYKGVDYNQQHIFKSLVYFHDAKRDPNPDLLQPVSWGDVKGFLEELVLKEALV